MKYSKAMNEMLALEAREVFVDANEYDGYELIGYGRLIKALCKRFNEPPRGQIKISNIQEILKTFDNRKYDVLRYRFWEGYTRKDIGILFDVSNERIRQIENVSLERLIPLIRQSEWTQNNIPIEALGLNPSVYWILKHAGINTLKQLMEEDYLSLKGIGPGTDRAVKQKLKELNIQMLSKEKYQIEKQPIAVLEFSTRVSNALKRKGIFLVGQLMEMPIEDVYKVRGIGFIGYMEVLTKKQSLECLEN